MSSLRLATAANVRAFNVLSDTLAASDDKWVEGLDGDALEDEVGRFRVWAGNLGALQKGHSSLDYRLRDSPNLLSSALKLLEELEHNLSETYAVVSGARLPYEAQPSTNEVEEDEDDDGFFSEEDDSDSDEPRNELKMRFEEVVDIIDNLYKLSVRIRTPSIRSRSLKASSYMPTDPETGVDIIGAYAELDKKHVQELLSQLRQTNPSDPSDDRAEQAFLIDRLSSSITLRRRHFKYWKRHRDKLGASAISEEVPEPGTFAVNGEPHPVRGDNLETHQAIPIITTLRPTPSQKTGKTLLSGTEATHHHQSLDDIVDTKSVTSYAVTVRDLHGKGIELPPPPKAANGDKDFECPYCWIVCPARYGKGRAWKTHLLQDLQPYICTYRDCEHSEQFFRSRREWAEHEASHRKLWRCPEHVTALYSSRSSLENHLRQDHDGSFPEDQIAIVAKIGETTAMDTRTECPICYAPADTEGLGDLQNHIANHLERFATFALPHSREDDSDGASSVASRGSSKSQSFSDSVRIERDDNVFASEEILELYRSSESLPVTEPGQTLLSIETLRQLPDESQNRLAMIAGQLEDVDDSEDEQLDDDILPAYKEHMEDQEAFRQHVLSLPGASSVRFYRRYGSWNGLIIFADDIIGEQAIALFDVRRFPGVEFKSKKNKSKWQFARTSGTRKDNVFNRQSTTDTQTPDDADIPSSESESYAEEDQATSKQAVLWAAAIPTLRLLYQSRRLLQRDQSFAPNDAYNQMISFCHYDLTRLRVDAIVSNAPTNLKASPTPESLHDTILRAGGSGLKKEARSKGRIKVGQVELTHGHALPSSWVIHAAAPTYIGSKGVGQFNVLSECYRSALRLAATHELKTIAFPCLGTGGCNFPPRVAARIALQEVREYLDAHPEHRPEQIIFCVRAAIDEKAYTDFLPVFFPPTHGDLDRARSSDWSANRAALAAQILEARSQLQKALTDMSDNYIFTSQTTACVYDMRRVDSALTSIRGYLLGSKELKRSLGDLNLLCSVVLTACASISEIAERAKEMGFAREALSLWDETNIDMQAKHGFDLSALFGYCWLLAKCLDDVLTRDMQEPSSMAGARQILETYGVKQKGQDVEGFRDYLDEIIHVRKAEQPTPNNRELIQVQQIPSVARLYLLGNLEAKPTMAQPSTSFNHAVCLLRDDITRLVVDVIVNSTDTSFAGMGTLDRSIFKKGGEELREVIKRFGTCGEGDVKVTPGYLLPAKHIFHVVPPEQFRKDTKNVLRNIYREILHTAVELKASSVAIPSIGTGRLSYPRRDCASLAMEEVKRFLESAEPGNGLDKIIFVVFSSNDEFIYKSLLPVYFPPSNGKAPDKSQREGESEAKNQAAMNIYDHMRREAEREGRERDMRERDALLSASVQQPAGTQESPSSLESLAKDPDVLSGSVDETFRIVRFGKHPATSRPMNYHEEHAFVQFESHVNDCGFCYKGLHKESRLLCDRGYSLARNVVKCIDISKDANIYSKADDSGERVKLEVPMDSLPASMKLISNLANKSMTIGSPAILFDEAEKPPSMKHEDKIQEDDNIIHASLVEDTRDTISATESPAVVQVEYRSPFSPEWKYSWIRVNKSKIEMYLGDYDPDPYGESSGDTPHVLIDLTDNVIELEYDDAKTVTLWTDSAVRRQFRSAEPVDAVALFRLFQRAINRSRPKPRRNVSPEAEEAKDLAPAIEPFEEFRVKFFVDTRNDWAYSLVHVHESRIDIYLEDSSGEVGTRFHSIDLSTPSTDPVKTGFNTVSFMTYSRQAGRWSKRIWHFRGADASDAGALFGVLQTAITRNRETRMEGVPSEVGEAADSASTLQLAAPAGDSGTNVDTNPYSLWNRTLRDLKDVIGIKRLDDKRKGPQAVTHSLRDTVSSSGDGTNYAEAAPESDAEDLPENDALSKKVLAYLANDLKTRSGSYIGQTTNGVADAVGIDAGLVNTVLHILAVHGRVHNTVDDNTWVISQQIDELYSLDPEAPSESQSLTDTNALADQVLLYMSRATRELSISDVALAFDAPNVPVWNAVDRLEANQYIQGAVGRTTWTLTNLGRTRALEIQSALRKAEQEATRDTASVDPNEKPSGDLSERALSYLKGLPGISENISDLTTTFDTPVAELQPVLEQLGSDGLVENKGDEFSWTAILPADDQESALPQLPSQFSPKGTTQSVDIAADTKPTTTPKRPMLSEDTLSSAMQSLHTPEVENTGHSSSPMVEGEQLEPTAMDDANFSAPIFRPEPDGTAAKQEQLAADPLATSKAGSWRDGRGANKRKQTRSKRILAEALGENLGSGTASSLRQARMTKEKTHKKSSWASADVVDDELEYYDGQEEDYVDEEEEPPKK
ncbi:hypothetical protein G6011_01112 [Alternaria panax]|uniref:Macro domain-containing protein n=1 Tax=Alternaria panax TaxID=48097 RepID=A0AAD4IKE9_9PLEO|nr:hypothetical protein G6011_01112 [Alternaria panax]